MHTALLSVHSVAEYKLLHPYHGGKQTRVGQAKLGHGVFFFKQARHVRDACLVSSMSENFCLQMRFCLFCKPTASVAL